MTLPPGAGLTVPAGGDVGMVLAAASGSGGCEVLAFSNWVLRREDEMGCALFEPVDRLEGRSRPRPDLGYPAQERLPPLSAGASPSPR